MKSVLDRSFHYTPSVQTDIRKTFTRIRREIRDQQKAREGAELETKSNVSPIKPASKTAAF